MPNDDDDKRGSRDNTGKQHNPKHARNNENAPDGHLGTNRIFTTGLNLGGSSKSRHTTQAGEKSQQQTQKPEQATPNKSPYAVKTGVAAIDKQSIADGYQLKTEAELKAMAQGEKKQPDRPKVSQSAFAKSFRQARDQAPKVNKPKGPELD